MSPFLIILITIGSLFMIFQVAVYIKSKKSVGNPIIFDKIDPEIASKMKDISGLLYFHSPSCHNCKTQTPIIENLKNKYDSIISVDASQNLQTARAFNIMGTPSILFFGGNKIKGYYVGVKNESFIIEKLKSV